MSTVMDLHMYVTVVTWRGNIGVMCKVTLLKLLISMGRLFTIIMICKGGRR